MLLQLVEQSREPHNLGGEPPSIVATRTPHGGSPPRLVFVMDVAKTVLLASVIVKLSSCSTSFQGRRNGLAGLCTTFSLCSASPHKSIQEPQSN
jgi:hypothetical protein